MQIVQFSITDKKLTVKKKIDDLNISTDYDRDGVADADAIEVAGSVIATKVFKLLFGDGAPTATYAKKFWFKYDDAGVLTALKVQAETQTAISSETKAEGGDSVKESANVASRWKTAEWVESNMEGVDTWFATVHEKFIPSLPTL